MGEKPREQSPEERIEEEIRMLKERAEKSPLSRADQGRLNMWERTKKHAEVSKKGLEEKQKSMEGMTAEQQLKLREDEQENRQRQIKEGSDQIYKRLMGEK